MIYYKRLLISGGLFLGIVFLLTGCSDNRNIDNNTSASESKEEKIIQVMVSILPQKEFVKKIGGNRVLVTAMIPPGFSPATYEPTPEQIKKLSKADLYIRIGQIPFEKSQMKKLKKINPAMKIIDSSEGIQFRNIEAHDHAIDKDNHPEDNHGHEGVDPHIWLSPVLVKKQVENIYQALVEVSPEDENYFKENRDQYLAELEALDKKLQEILKPLDGQKILVYHPAFGYFTDRYGLTQEAVEIEGKEPTPLQLEKIMVSAKEANIKVIFIQRQFSPKSAEILAQEIGGTVVAIDPLAENYTENLEQMAVTMQESLK